jgi:hypothetical protein
LIGFDVGAGGDFWSDLSGGFVVERTGERKITKEEIMGEHITRTNFFLMFIETFCGDYQKKSLLFNDSVIKMRDRLVTDQSRIIPEAFKILCLDIMSTHSPIFLAKFVVDCTSCNSDWRKVR